MPMMVRTVAAFFLTGANHFGKTLLWLRVNVHENQTKLNFSVKATKLKFPRLLNTANLYQECKQAVFFSWNSFVFPRKRRFRVNFLTYLASPSRTENRLFSFHSHFEIVKRRIVVIQSAFCRTIACLNKHSSKNIRFMLLFGGEQNQSILQRWVSQSMKQLSFWPCAISRNSKRF